MHISYAYIQAALLRGSVSLGDGASKAMPKCLPAKPPAEDRMGAEYTKVHSGRTYYPDRQPRLRAGAGVVPTCLLWGRSDLRMIGEDGGGLNVVCSSSCRMSNGW